MWEKDYRYENAEMGREEKVKVRAIVAYPQSRTSRD